MIIVGGGTMTREACTLNIPSYSFFGGTKGDDDKYLESKNLSTYINNIGDIKKILFTKRTDSDLNKTSNTAFLFVKSFIEKKLDGKK